MWLWRPTKIDFEIVQTGGGPPLPARGLKTAEGSTETDRENLALADRMEGRRTTVEQRERVDIGTEKGKTISYLEDENVLDG